MPNSKNLSPAKRGLRASTRIASAPPLMSSPSPAASPSSALVLRAPPGGHHWANLPVQPTYSADDQPVVACPPPDIPSEQPAPAPPAASPLEDLAAWLPTTVARQAWARLHGWDLGRHATSLAFRLYTWGLGILITCIVPKLVLRLVVTAVEKFM